MDLERVNIVAILVTILVGQTALTLGEDSPLFLLIAVMVCAWWVLGYLRGREPRLSRWLFNSLVLALCGVVFIEFLASSPRSLFVAAAHFVAGAQLLLFIENRSIRNCLWICAITLCEFAVSTVRTVELAFGLLLPLMVISVGFALFVNQLRRVEAGEGRAISLRPALLVIAKLSVVVLASAAVVFFALPRVRASIFLRGARVRTHPISGFARRVNLGEIGRIKLSRRKVMDVSLWRAGKRVRAEGIPLYWRGGALDHYDGKRWTCTSKPRLIDPGGVGKLLRGWRVAEKPGPAAVRQVVTLQPINTRSIFMLYPVIELNVPGRKVVWFDPQSGSVGLFRYLAPAMRYEVVSDPAPPASARVKCALSPRELHRYLQVPDVISSRTRALARTLVAGAKTPLDKANAIERYLKRSGVFSYTLEITPARGEPLDNFLFRTHAGHCEYFASAMVILLRVVGVPARMVNGFKGGEWNEFGGFYTVREWHAHSWVEAFLPGMGWKVFDPTPDVSLELGLLGTIEGLFTRFFEFMDVKWVNLFIAYSEEEQRELMARFAPALKGILGLKDIFEGVSTFFEDLSRRVVGVSGENDGNGEASTIPRVVATVIVLSLTLFLGGAIFFVARRGARWLRQGAAREEPVAKLYRHFLKAMAARGLRCDPCETPLEFARRVIRSGAAPGDSVMGITVAFCEKRYGEIEIPPNRIKALSEAVRSLRKKR